MSFLKQISDKAAVLSWSPVIAHGNVVALGTKDSAGAGFDDYGGELEIHRLDFSDTGDTSSTLLGRSKTNANFSSLAWSHPTFKSSGLAGGLIAGGLSDGSINIWNPSILIEGGQDSLLHSFHQHQKGVFGLQFNPHSESSHLLASGGGDSDVFVVDLSRPDSPNIYVPAPPPSNAKHTAEITRVAWNTQVSHILASASQNGSTIIWDLRQKKAWCELRDPTNGSISDISWNPDQGLHFITASGEDRTPVIKLWDLRSSTTLPLATLSAHTEGVLSVAWCPSDSTLVLSSGKDNKTILWDLANLQPVFELPAGGARSSATDAGFVSKEGGMFGELASSAGQKRYQVSWSPCLPAVISACSFDRKIQFYSLVGAKSKLGRAPKWLRNPVGAFFAFGGKLVSFNNKSVTMTLYATQEDTYLSRACDEFQAALSTGDYKGFCDRKANDASLSEQDRQVWSLMKVICFEKNAREELLCYLGFNAAVIAETVANHVTGRVDANRSAYLPPPPPPLGLLPPPPGNVVSAEELFGELPTPPAQEGLDGALGFAPPPPPPISTGSLSGVASSPEVMELAKEMAVTALAGQEAEPLIRDALVVGNFAAAVDCCVEAGMMAEALLLAQCGEPDLFVRTQALFLEKQSAKKPFLKLLRAVIRNEFLEYVTTSDLDRWQDTLALLSTYGKNEEFSGLCEALGLRLEEERGDRQSATLCYMCATNVERTVSFWASELRAANEASGRLDYRALQEFIEKAELFTLSNPSADVGEECRYYYSQYAFVLASLGRLDVAAKFIKGSGLENSVLRDRIFQAHAPAASATSARAPPFPFERVQVQAAAKKQPKVATASVPVSASTVENKKLSQTATRAGVSAGNTLPSAQQQQPQPVQPQQQLLPGWMQVIDPSSGRPYYVNQAMQLSQWEPPLAPGPAPAPAVAPVPSTQSNPIDNRGQAIASAPTAQVTSLKPANTAPRSQGFPAGLKDPRLAAASAAGASAVAAKTNVVAPASVAGGAGVGYHTGGYANPGSAVPVPSQPGPGGYINNPHAPSGVGGQMAKVNQPVAAPGVAGRPVAPAPVPVPVVVLPLPPSVLSIDQLVSNLSASGALSVADKRQLAMVQESITVLKSVASSSELAPDVMERLEQLVAALLSRNYTGANAAQTALANSYWSQHKDWIKGLKVLIQLMGKK